MWGGDPRRLYASAQDWGQVLMIGGKSCSHGRAFTTFITLAALEWSQQAFQTTQGFYLLLELLCASSGAFRFWQDQKEQRARRY